MKALKKSTVLFVIFVSVLSLIYQVSADYTLLATANDHALLDPHFDCAAYANFVGAEPLAHAVNCTDFLQRPSPASTNTPRPLAPTDIGFAQDIFTISNNVVEFTLNDFAGQTVLSSNLINTLYAFDYDSTATTLYALNNTPPQFGTFDKNSGTFSPIALSMPEIGHTWSGLAIHPIDDTIYASSTDASASALYTIHPSTGQPTLIGEMVGLEMVISIAINAEGELYAHDIDTDAIYRIDPLTAVPTLIGPTGYDANFAQGMDFDNDDGTLYIFLYLGGGANIFGTVNLQTGAVTPLAVDSPPGEFEGAIEIPGQLTQPVIDLTPDELQSTQLVDTQTSHTVEIANLGNSDLHWQLDNNSATGSYENGPLRTSIGDGPNGADVSLMQDVTFPLNIYGFSVYPDDDDYYRLSDQFTVTHHAWPLDEITFYAYQTGSPITSTITSLNYQIWDGPPNDSNSNVIYGDTTTNRLVDTGWTGIYRFSESLTEDTRPIMYATAVPHITLPPGTYWLDWQLAGSLPAGPWHPPVTVLGFPTTGDALQLTETGWILATSGTGPTYPQGMPFDVSWQISCDDPSTLSWLNVTPTSGTVPPGTDDELQITLDSTGLTPDTYTATVCISSNDPNSITTTLPITLTVNPIPIVHGVDVDAPVDSQSGLVTTAVTYTVNITNTGSHTDTFTISLAGNSWPSTANPTSFTLASGQNDQLLVTVDIPAGANQGDTDIATLTAVSQGNINASDSLTLTTTAVTDPTLPDVQLGSLDPDITAPVGTTATYTVAITNTGSHTDTFAISLAGNNWPTLATPTAVTLPVGQSSEITVAVDVPLGAAYGDTDQVAVTATSQTDTNVSATLDLTTTAVPVVYSVDLDALDEDLFGPIGTSVTYTLELINIGSIVDTYDLFLSSHEWNAVLDTTQVTLQVGQRATLFLQIDIPSHALDGDTDTVTITAVSHANNTITDSVELLTTALDVPSTYDVHLQTTDPDLLGPIGSTVTYTVAIYNQGTAADTYQISLAGHQWPSYSSSNTVVLNAGEQTTLLITVQVPPTTAVGDTDAVTVTATSQTDGTIFDALTLTTTAVEEDGGGGFGSTTVYLPIIRRP